MDNYNENYTEQQIIKGLYQNQGYAKCIFDTLKGEYFNNDKAGSIFELEKDYYFSNKELLEPKAFSPEIKEFFDSALALEFNVCERQTELVNITNEYMKNQIRKYLMLKSVNALDDNTGFEKSIENILELNSFMISGGDNFDCFISGPDWNSLEFGDIQYHLYPLIPESSIILVVGDRGVGKTIFLMSLCDAITKGEDFGPWINQLGSSKILYVDGELPHKLNQKNTKQLNVNDNFINYCRSYVYDNTENENLVLTDPGFREHIKNHIKENDIKVVIFDNLSMLAPGLDENAKKDYDIINQYFLSLRFLGVTVLVVHHTGKSGQQRGTSAREDNADLILYLRYTKNHKTEDGAKFDLSFRKFRHVVENGDLVKSRQLWYQKNLSDSQCNWIFDKLDLSNDPEFYIDAARDRMSEKDLAKKYNVNQATVNRKIKKLEENNLITVEGKTKNKIIEMTKTGRDWLGI